jgi:hypothetical protein
MVKKVNEKPKEDIDFDTPYVSQWEHFEIFLSELINDDNGNSRFKSAILRLFFNDEELELHEKIKELFNTLTDFDDKVLISMVYDSGCDKVEVKFDKSESMIHMEGV